MSVLQSVTRLHYAQISTSSAPAGAKVACAFETHAAKAYEAAYRARGAAAISGASRLLNQANVAAAVQVLRDKLSEKLEVTAQRVLEEWVAMGFYDAADLMVLDPGTSQPRNITSPLDLRLLPERVRRCVIGWTYDKAGNFILKLAPKTPNLELIARRLGMFVERKELRLGDLEKKSDAELDAAIAQALSASSTSTASVSSTCRLAIASLRRPLRGRWRWARLEPVAAALGAPGARLLRLAGHAGAERVRPAGAAAVRPAGKTRAAT